MTNLSPAAQAVLSADASARCLSEWDSVNDPPCHPSDSEWNGCIRCINRAAVAAAIRAAADQVVPTEMDLPPIAPDLGHFRQHERRLTRQRLLAIAAELEALPDD